MALPKAIASVFLAISIVVATDCFGKSAAVVRPSQEDIMARLLAADTVIDLPSGESLGLVYNKLVPLPGAPDDAFVVLASWTGRLLRCVNFRVSLK